jgi:chloramphenicol 3-O phosphotransferase
MKTTRFGQIILLNGAPRSGKSSIAREIQATFAGVWMNLGVDVLMQATPEQYLPGIGLRPGGERPDLEPYVVQMYRALYDSIAAHSRQGLNVVADVGHHDAYSVPLGVLHDCLRRLDGLPVLFVGVHCPLETIMKRRRQTGYNTETADDPIPAPVLRWQTEVHRDAIYDLELDTSVLSPTECATTIRQTLANPPAPSALTQIVSFA